MSVIQPPVRALQQFFRSGPMPCPYIPGRVERKLFTRLTAPTAADVNSMLSKAGFRRSHDIVYRPVCPNCTACVPVRIPVGTFVPTRSLRRVLRLGADLETVEVPAVATHEQYRLFAAYQASRHGDSDMARMTLTDYAAMVDEGRADTSIFEIRNPGDRLVGAMLTDRLHDGLSAVYSFYDAEDDRLSLGTYMILALVERARLEGLPHVYLGYWIRSSRKMAYKARFRPLEGLGPDGWGPIAPPAPEEDGPAGAAP